jgi:curved DNA-binding protein CbpA
MKATLYEALGIAQNAPDEEVRDALRRVIRKYYAKTRDGHGNVEEALRFINHASRILSDPDRRARYDQELALAASPTEDRIAHVVSSAVADDAEGSDVHAPVSAPSPEELFEERFGDADPKPERIFHHPGLTERVASFGRSTLLTVAVCVLFGGFIAAAIVFVTPENAVLLAKQVLVWLTLTLIGLALV